MDGLADGRELGCVVGRELGMVGIMLGDGVGPIDGMPSDVYREDISLLDRPRL